MLASACESTRRGQTPGHWRAACVSTRVLVRALLTIDRGTRSLTRTARRHAPGSDPVQVMLACRAREHAPGTDPGHWRAACVSINDPRNPFAHANGSPTHAGVRPRTRLLASSVREHAPGSDPGASRVREHAGSCSLVANRPRNPFAHANGSTRSRHAC